MEENKTSFFTKGVPGCGKMFPGCGKMFPDCGKMFPGYGIIKAGA